MDSMQSLTDLRKAWWVYAGVAMPVAETVLVASGSSAIGFSSLRILFGLFTLGFFPGFLTVRALFPNETMTALEIVLLSVFLSLVIAVGTGMGLGLGPFFNAVNVSLVLTGYSVLCSLGAAYRNFFRQEKPDA